MDQNLNLFQEAKQILNADDSNAYTDSEIVEILSLLNKFSDIIYFNLI
ncbi:MAG: hypothetical protein P8H40_02395 [Winogradskyella sp.]|nr:hypothetical protein [Winogradskyella sp.]